MQRSSALGCWRSCDSFHPSASVTSTSLAVGLAPLAIMLAPLLAIVTLLDSGEPPPGDPSPESTVSAE
jgi:hypothetical protein